MNETGPDTVILNVGPGSLSRLPVANSAAWFCARQDEEKAKSANGNDSFVNAGRGTLFGV